MVIADKLSYKERISLVQNRVAKQLLETMIEKKSNLGLVADVTSKEELLQLADSIGPHICILKTHIDIVNDYDQELILRLCQLAEKHHFLLFEDRKFADIGNTVKHQYRDGIYQISDWAHITNAHIIAGPGTIQALREVGLPKNRALLLLAQLSSKGSLATGHYTEAAVRFAHEFADFVMGFISQERVTDNPSFLHITPGVNISSAGDQLGQQYNSPEKVIGERGSDVMLVGRGILHADNPLAEAKIYQERGWGALYP